MRIRDLIIGAGLVFALATSAIAVPRVTVKGVSDDGNYTEKVWMYDTALLGWLAFDTERVGLDKVEVINTSDAYFAGLVVTCGSTAGMGAIYDLATTTLSGIPILEFGCPAVASETFVIMNPGGVLVETANGVTASTSKFVMIYVYTRDKDANMP